MPPHSILAPPGDSSSPSSSASNVAPLSRRAASVTPQQSMQKQSSRYQKDALSLIGSPVTLAALPILVQTIDSDVTVTWSLNCHPKPLGVVFKSMKRWLGSLEYPMKTQQENLPGQFTKY